ncbi:MAG TPA: hypothetical protein VHE30_30660 [Polyangiaceae bacterium]|nr:hypothetical protein [Polyangiaceae bacterium]
MPQRTRSFRGAVVGAALAVGVAAVLAGRAAHAEERSASSGFDRGLSFLYLDAEGGLESLGLETFQANDLVDATVVKTTQTGGLLGVGAGVRLIFLTLGPRFRIGVFDAYQVWTLNGELGIKVPLGRFEPHFELGAGYASLGAFSKDDLGGPRAGDVSITGYDVRGGGGLDVFVTRGFSIGANVSAEVLGLTRPGVSLDELASNNGATVDVNGNANVKTDNLYSLDGSSLGFGFTCALVLGLHL